MAANNFDETMTALFKGMDGFITSKTVVGDAIKFEDGTTILPLVDVSFGAGAGAFASESKKKDKEDKTVAEEKVQDMPETEEDVAKKINS